MNFGFQHPPGVDAHIAVRDQLTSRFEKDAVLRGEMQVNRRQENGSWRRSVIVGEVERLGHVSGDILFVGFLKI